MTNHPDTPTPNWLVAAMRESAGMSPSAAAALVHKRMVDAGEMTYKQRGGYNKVGGQWVVKLQRVVTLPIGPLE